MSILVDNDSIWIDGKKVATSPPEVTEDQFWDDLIKQVESIEIGEANKVPEEKICTCSMETIIRSGCQCGGK